MYIGYSQDSGGELGLGSGPRLSFFCKAPFWGFALLWLGLGWVLTLFVLPFPLCLDALFNGAGQGWFLHHCFAFNNSFALFLSCWLLLWLFNVVSLCMYVVVCKLALLPSFVGFVGGVSHLHQLSSSSFWFHYSSPNYSVLQTYCSMQLSKQRRQLWCM
jgi:hypothetical protein